MKRAPDRVRPSDWIGSILAIALGAAFGTAGYTFYYAKGASYLTNDPKACVNCHVMRSQYDGWSRSSHRAVATCNDCHAPHGLLGKYLTKAENGFWHSVAFTSGNFKDPIRIKPRNLAVTERSCLHCHEAVVHAIGPAKGMSCVSCHSGVGHMK